MLTDKVALVTGGSRGIGRACALALSSLGCRVAIVYAGNEEAAQKTLGLLGETSRAYKADVSDFSAVKELVAQVKKDFSRIDILINNAGVTRDGLVMTMREEDYDRVLDVNLKGAFNMIRFVSPIMLRQRAGRIINISSISGMMGNPGQANYSASKAGLIGLTKSVARELASRGITCNAIAPGFIDTDMTGALENEGEIASRVPLGRVGTPEDVAETAAFLAGRGGDYITGEVIRVDGGMAM